MKLTGAIMKATKITMETELLLVREALKAIATKSQGNRREKKMKYTFKVEVEADELQGLTCKGFTPKEALDELMPFRCTVTDITRYQTSGGDLD